MSSLSFFFVREACRERRPERKNGRAKSLPRFCVASFSLKLSFASHMKDLDKRGVACSVWENIFANH